MGVRLLQTVLVDGLDTDLTAFSDLAEMTDLVGVATFALLFTMPALSFVGDLVASRRLLLKEGDPVYGDDVTPDRSLKVGESRGDTMVCRITTRLAAVAGDLG